MKTDVVIVGGGPGGTASSMFLSRLGIRSVIVEKEPFPRYHIGESMTGEAGVVLRDLGLESTMLAQKHPIKHGVRVFGPTGKSGWFVPVMKRDAAGDLQDQFTWQVRRSDFDHMMLEEASGRGAEIVRGQAYEPILADGGAVGGARVRMPDGSSLDIKSQMLLDCSGQTTFLANQRVTGPKYRGIYDKQIAIFSQVAGGIRDNGEARDEQPGNTLIFYQKKFHWAWWIPLDDEVVSVGVVCPAAYFKETGESQREFLVRELQELNPELARRLPEIELVEDVHVIPNYSYQVRSFTGKGFICIGDAHRFLDPIFSFGLYVTMKEAQFAAGAVQDYLAGKNRDAANPFAAYQRAMEQGIDVLEDVLDAFWEHPLAFALLVHSRHTEDLIDVFAGRIYDNQPSAGVLAFRKMLDRERVYGDESDEYSIPIGARFHPERAPIWNADEATVALTEKWMRER